MLSDKAKLVLRESVDACVADGEFDALVKDGPATLVAFAVEAATRYAECIAVREFIDNIVQNKPEAEQYVAGLLGMM